MATITLTFKDDTGDEEVFDVEASFDPQIPAGSTPDTITAAQLAALQTLEFISGIGENLEGYTLDAEGERTEFVEPGPDPEGEPTE